MRQAAGWMDQTVEAARSAKRFNTFMQVSFRLFKKYCCQL